MGRGVAYSTEDAAHLLNVRAEEMSALAAEPGHFAERFSEAGGSSQAFAQRRFYGRYLQELLLQAVDAGGVKPIAATALNASRESSAWHIELDDKTSLRARVLVLALGNEKPDTPRELAALGSRLIGDPWGRQAREAVKELAASGAPALIIGTGLTMVDLVLSLDAAAYAGKCVAVSRRGLTPRRHDDDSMEAADNESPPARLRTLARWVRKRGEQIDWRAAVDALRPHSHSLWQGFTVGEQRRFLRHVRPWWDVHRHRIAPEVASVLHDRIAAGSMEIIAGRIVSADSVPEGARVEYRRRGSAISQSSTFRYVFNSTGPLHAISRSANPLLRTLLDSGEVKVDQLGIGIDVDGTCRAGEHLWAMGPLTKGRYWEIVAVPDIREQAKSIADEIERELSA